MVSQKDYAAIHGRKRKEKQDKKDNLL